jgi:hypothetical protein
MGVAVVEVCELARQHHHRQQVGGEMSEREHQVADRGTACPDHAPGSSLDDVEVARQLGKAGGEHVRQPVRVCFLGSLVNHRFSHIAIGRTDDLPAVLGLLGCVEARP